MNNFETRCIGIFKKSFKANIYMAVRGFEALMRIHMFKIYKKIKNENISF